MQEENTTPEVLADVSQLNTPATEGTVGSVPGDNMTLAEINAALGKNFPTKDSALKSFKDTFSYVGKKKEDIEREVTSRLQNDNHNNKLAQEIEEMRKERFYDKNPQYSSLRSVIEKAGGNPAEVVNQDWFKEISTKVSGYDESQKLKTVLESNPRLASSRDALGKARELSQSGGSKDAIESNILSAVKDAYGM